MTVQQPRAVAVRGATLTIDHVWLAATLTFAWVAGTLLHADQMDYWWSVKLGEELWSAWRFPVDDTLAFTSTRGAYTQPWLAQLALAATHHVGGLDAALVLR